MPATSAIAVLTRPHRNDWPRRSTLRWKRSGSASADEGREPHQDQRHRLARHELQQGEGEQRDRRAQRVAAEHAPVDRRAAA